MGENNDYRSVYNRYVRPCVLTGVATFAALYGTLLFLEPSYSKDGNDKDHLTEIKQERTLDRYIKRVKRQWPKHFKPFLEDLLGDL